MATASGMILRSLRLRGEKTIDGTLSTAEQTAYLADLNTMLESWALERLMVPNLFQESFPLTSSTGSYTIGPGGDFNTARPNKIVAPCFIRDSDNADLPVEIINAQAYGSIAEKTIDGSYPRYLFCDYASVSGLATIYLYPEPSSGLTLYINSWKQLQNFPLISTVVSLPPGYQRAIEFNLAIETAGGYMSVMPEVAKIAKESKAALKSLNQPDTIMQLDAGALLGRGHVPGANIFTGP